MSLKDIRKLPDKGYYKTCKEITTIIVKLENDINTRVKEGRNVARLEKRLYDLWYTLSYIKYSGPCYFLTKGFAKDE